MTLCAVVHAETVTRKEANAVAQTFFNAAYGEVTAPPQMVWNGRNLTTDRLFSPFLVYNSPKGGYVIVSSENKAYPILGYSLKRTFDRNKLSESEKELLKKYAMEIEVVRYDPRISVKALHAWQNMREYIAGILERPYDSDEYRNLSSERKNKIEELDRAGKQILMAQATEFESLDPDNYRRLTLDDVSAAEEIPFKFYDDFIKSVRDELNRQQINLDELISPSKPVVKSIGDGHFEITYPENIRMMRIYAVSGMQMMEKYFKETRVMNIDLSALSPGYYIGLGMADSGKIYGFKFCR